LHEKSRGEKMEKFILIGFLFLIFSTGVVSAADLSNSGGGDWKYYREITIKENSGKTLTDYQVLIELNSANFDFSKAKSDGSDVRFVDSEGNELNYWIEEWRAGKAKIWVKVPLIPANGEAKIRMYYGNPSALSSSNGYDVFELFDDFEDGDVSDWIVWNPASKYSVDSGVKRNGGHSMKLIDTSYSGKTQVYKNFEANNFVLEGYFRMLYSDEASDRGSGSIRLIETVSSNLPCGEREWAVIFSKDGTVTVKKDCREYESTGIEYLPNTWYKVVIYANTDTDELEIFFDDKLLGKYIDLADLDMIKKIQLDTAGVKYVNTMWVDDLFIRKYADQEPTFTISAEHLLTKTAQTPTEPSETPGILSLNIDIDTLLKQGEIRKGILTVKNEGNADAKFVKVKLSSESLGINVEKSYVKIPAGEAREFVFEVNANDAGTFKVSAYAEYWDDEGNKYVETSEEYIHVEAIGDVTGEKSITPGFEAIFAIIGLILVTYTYLRKEKR